MAESFITQCPHCGTSFRVRTEQLAVANGSVRCGACLQVFSARNHVVTTSVPAQKVITKPVAKPAASKPAAARPAASKAAAAPVKKAAKPAPPPPPKPKPPSRDDFNFTTDDDDDAEFLFADGEDDDDFVFEDNASDSLFDEEEKDDGFGELSDSFLNLNDSSSSKRQPDHFQRETQELEREIFDEDDENDESWAESMLEEIEKEGKISTSKPAVFEAQEMGQSKRKQQQSRTQSAMLMDFDDDFSQTSSVRKPSASQVVNKASQEIELDFHIDERLSRLRPLGWLVVVALFLLLLAQGAWMMRDTYARMDQWRGLYLQACNVFGCELPEQVDMSAIRTSLIVREHKDPNLSDIRMVDVVLNNKAPFKQPFPTLVMQYTDVNGNLVADQAFTPDQYLEGELTGVELMPKNTRVYISFPIRKPANNAVNWQLLLQRSPSS